MSAVVNLRVVLTHHLPVRTSFTISILVMAGARLSTNANAVAYFDASGNIFAYSNGLTNDFMTNTDGIVSWTPPRSQSVKI